MRVVAELGNFNCFMIKLVPRIFGVIILIVGATPENGLYRAVNPWPQGVAGKFIKKIPSFFYTRSVAEFKKPIILSITSINKYYST